MRYTSAKEKVSLLIEEARTRLEALGVIADAGVELAENELAEGECDVLKVFGSIGIRTAELTEDEVFYLSVDLDVYDEEVDEEAYNKAEAEFTAALDELVARLESEENKTEAIRALDREIDEALEAAQREELARAEKATRRDLTVAVIALVVIAFVAFAFMVISKLAG